MTGKAILVTLRRMHAHHLRVLAVADGAGSGLCGPSGEEQNAEEEELDDPVHEHIVAPGR